MNKRTIAIAVVAMVAVIALVMPVQATTYTYNRQVAVDYALDNAKNDVPGSATFKTCGGDCTNFVSHCLNQGGWPMTSGSWWTTGSTSRWFYGSIWYYSNTWTCADEFSDYLAIYSGRASMRSLGHKPLDKYFQIGDIVQIDYTRDGRWDHTMIITNIKGGEPKDMYVTYHSPSMKNEPLQDIMDRHKSALFMGYHLNDRFSS